MVLRKHSERLGLRKILGMVEACWTSKSKGRSLSDYRNGLSRLYSIPRKRRRLITQQIHLIAVLFGIKGGKRK